MGITTSPSCKQCLFSSRWSGLAFIVLCFLDCFGSRLHRLRILSILRHQHMRDSAERPQLSHPRKSYIFSWTVFSESLLRCFLSLLKIIHFPTVSPPFPFCATMDKAARAVISSRRRPSICASVSVDTSPWERERTIRDRISFLKQQMVWFRFHLHA